MNNKKYILFDLDGTITDPKEGITKSVAFALKKYGITPPENLDDLCHYIGPPLHYTLKKDYNLSDADAVKMVDYYREYYKPYGLYQCYVYDGIPELLKDLKSAEKKVLLATSKPEEMAKKVLEYFNLLHFFDGVYGATLDTSRTEKSKVIEYALKECHIKDLSEAVMVGDRSFDIIGGKANGIDTIGVKYGYMQSKTELEDAGACAVCNTVDDLYTLLLR